jgi:hypothetical protein
MDLCDVSGDCSTHDRVDVGGVKMILHQDSLDIGGGSSSGDMLGSLKNGRNFEKSTEHFT